MTNTKATEKQRVVLEFGVLIRPFRDLRDRTDTPRAADYRLAIAMVRGGDGAWRQHVRDFTTFARDVRFDQEFQHISHVPERLWQFVTTVVESPRMATDPEAVHAAFVTELQAAEDRFHDLIDRVPVQWQPVIFHANTPFTAYLSLRDAVGPVRTRLHYFDRYLNPNFFELFLRDVDRSIEIRLATTASGVRDVSQVSDLARLEFADYQLLELAPSQFHDRNLRIDDQVFSLGPGVDRAGVALTNFGPSDSTPAGHGALDGLLQGGTIVHRS